MSLRPAKVGILKSGLKNLSAASSLNNYCTKTRVFDEKTFIYVSKESPQRRSNELLGPNPDFPFLGDISFDKDLKAFIKEAQANLANHTAPEKFETLSQPTTSDGLLRYRISEITEIIQNQMRLTPDPQYLQSSPLVVEVMKADRSMELKALPCPKTLKKDVEKLFVNAEIDKTKNITVLNLTQKSSTDMSKWSEDMEVERDLLTKDFINIASAICHDLQKLSGGKYWADFIEPTSGRPYFGKYTNATLFETDDRYRDLGFKIEDLGCCKVIKHVKWSTHAFIGTIFTDAPIESAEIKKILANSKAGQYFEEQKQEITLMPIVEEKQLIEEH